MANPAFVQTAAGASGTATGTATTGSITSTTGNLFVVVCAAASNTLNRFSSVSDNKGNTYTRILSKNASNSDLEVWYKSNGSGGAGHTFTCTSAGAFDNVCVVAQEFSGSGALDVTAADSGTGTAVSSGPTTPTAVAPELVVVGAVTENNSAATLGIGYSNLADTGSGLASLRAHIESKIVLGVGNQIGTLTSGTSTGWKVICATFQSATPTAGSPAFRLNKMRPAIFKPGLAR